MSTSEKYSPKKIIVRMPNWIGDLVMATPVLTDLRRAYPEASITAMCRTPLSELLQEDKEIDELFCFSKVSSFGRRSEKRNIIEKLRQGKYDLGILLTHSFSSAWWFWQGKIGRRIGYECNGRRLLLTDSLPLHTGIQCQHLVTTYKSLLSLIDIPLSDSAPRIYLSEKELDEARQLFSQHGISKQHLVVGINPGATYGSAKCWLPERFRAVTQKLLRDNDVRIVYFGDQTTAPLVKEIIQGFSSRVVNLAGMTSIRQLVALISLCDTLLTNDSGPMHIADAVGTTVVALFGSTSEVITGPYQRGIVIHKHVECSPCYQRSCPIDFRCMKRIEADEVYEEIRKVLYEKKSKLQQSL